MAKDTLVKLKSTESKHVYETHRNKKSKGAQNKPKLELKKYDPNLRKHVLYKEAKK